VRSREAGAIPRCVAMAEVNVGWEFPPVSGKGGGMVSFLLFREGEQGLEDRPMMAMLRTMVADGSFSVGR